MDNRDLNKNNIYNSIATFVNILFPLITFPYVTRVLGVDGLGKYNFSNAIVSYFSLIATLGISSYAIRECAKLKNDRNGLNNLASEIFSIDIYSTIIAYLMLFVALLLSTKLKNYTVYILILSVSFIANTIGTMWICNAVDDFRYLSFKTIILHIVSLVCLFLFVKNENDLYKYIIISVGTNLVANIHCIFYRKKYVEVKFILFPNLKKHLKKIILLFSQCVSMLLYTNADMVMLGYYYNDETVGFYAIAVKIYNIINSVISSVITVATPGLSYDYSNKNYVAFNEKITYVVNYILFLFIPAFIGMNIMAPEIIKIVAGESFALSVASLRILTVSMMFSLISAIIGIGILFPMGHDKVNFYSCIISATSNIILNFYFIPKYGIIGAAFTTATAELLGILNKIKYIDKNIKVYGFIKSFFKYLLGGMLVALICIILKKILPNKSIYSMIIMILSAGSYFIYLIIIKDEFFKNFIKPVVKKIYKFIKI